MRWLRRSLWALLGLAVAVAIAAWAYGSRALPIADGELTVPGLSRPVRIQRDAHGIPSIRAENSRDLMFGLGFVHAQDRLWQLETHRRIGSGRLAEAFGEGALESDRFLRALGVRRAAVAQWASARAPTREALSAYAAGINAAVRTQMRARPPEMLILGVPAEDWEPVDSMAWAIMMAWDLGGNWSTELLRLRLAHKLPVARIDELIPPYPGEKPLPTADYVALLRGLKLDAGTSTAAVDRAWDRLLAAAPQSGIEGAGSNNWVLSGQRTQSGKPLLANDPHLKLSAPALWYFARLEAPGVKVAGATMPGLPIVVLGQNPSIAWGFTNTGPDVQDLYLERFKPDDPNLVQTPQGWAPLTSFNEVIKVKGKPDVAITVRQSRHGPLISDAGVVDDVLGANGKPRYAIALRWTALDPDVDIVDVGLAMSRARSAPEFIEAARGWVAPMQNMVVADSEGHIGWIAAGRVPVRKAENDLKGLVPAPGWDARYDWDGWLPADALPQDRDPERGWIATANQRVVPADYPHYITSEWAVPYRQQRIEQLLEARSKHGLDDLRAMQADVKSLAVPKILPWLLRANSSHAQAAAAKAELQGFDGTMAADRAAPLIFWAWARHLTQLVFADELGAAYERAIGSRTFRDALEGVLERDDAWWCDNKSTPEAESCQSQVDRAFTLALDELQVAQGADVTRWSWGRAHQARSEHRPFSRVGPLARWFELRNPVGGDTYTVNVSRVNFKADASTGEYYLDEHGPSLRALYDLADPANSRFMHSSGQSGIAWSPWYRSFVEPWARVQDMPLWTAEPPVHALTLKPGG